MQFITSHLKLIYALEHAVSFFFSINMDSPARMSEQKLRDSLEKLRSEIDQLADDDAPTKSKLAKLVNEIEAGIDPAQDLKDHKLSAAVKEAIQHFEPEHYVDFKRYYGDA